MVNTYLLFDETREAVIIDPGCYSSGEQSEISDFIEQHDLKLVRNLNTHCHIDHVLGNEFIAKKYGIYPEYHPDSVPFFFTVKEIGSSFGYTFGTIPDPARFLEDEEIVTFGNTQLKVLFTPGHAAGSVCFYNQQDGFVITGDVLFKDTIGRTDLPTGDFNQLMASIRNKLFTLPKTTIVYAGHGPETNIGYEEVNNPFIR